MIELRPYSDLSAMKVLERLDWHDMEEAQVTRGAAVAALSLFAEWRSMEPHRLLSVVAQTRGGTPFALLGLANTGQAGVAEAALLARDHARHRRPLAALAAAIRRDMPGWCVRHGVHRIEARCWFEHPTASGLLTALGFEHEADLSGFGPAGAAVFRQFAFIHRSRGDDHVHQKTRDARDACADAGRGL